MTSNSSSLAELIQKKDLIKDRFEGLQRGRISANEFVDQINPIMNELIFEQKWKEVIQNENLESLSKLLSNLNARTKTYKSLLDLGDDREANVQLAKLQDLGSQIINQLNSVITNRQKKEEKSKSDASIKGTSKETETETEIRELPFIGEKLPLEPNLDNLDRHRVKDERWIEREVFLSKLNNIWIDDSLRIISVTGIGGIGKTSLVLHWLDRYILQNESLRSFDGIFGWSFNDKSNPDAFVNTVSEYLSSLMRGFEENLGNGIKFDLINTTVNEKYLLFILDGLETLQEQNIDKAEYGTIESAAIKNFLNNFLSKGRSRCLITSRIGVADLVDIKLHKELPIKEGFGIDEAKKFLSNLGVINEDSGQIEILLNKWGTHPLTLKLLGTYISNFCEGKARDIDAIPSPPQSRGSDQEFIVSTKEYSQQYDQVNMLLNQYNKHFTEIHKMILMIISSLREPFNDDNLSQLFDTFFPKSESSISTINVTNVSYTEFKRVIEDLSKYYVIYQSKNEYVIHPLVRTHYSTLLDGKEYSGEVHKCLSKYYIDIAKSQVTYMDRNSINIDHLTPFIEAVYHSCKADEYDDGFKIYLENIDQQRGYLEYNLGAYETEYKIALNFVSQEGDVNPKLADPFKQVWMLRTMGHALMGKGRLIDSLNYCNVSYEKSIEFSDLNNAARALELMSYISIHLGNLNDVIKYADSAIQLYSLDLNRPEKSEYGSIYYCSLEKEIIGVQSLRSGPAHLISHLLAYKAWAQHQLGNIKEASETFKTSEEMTQLINEHFGIKYLYDLLGIYHAEHLIKIAKIIEDLQMTQLINERFGIKYLYDLLGIYHAEENAKQILLTYAKAINEENLKFSIKKAPELAIPCYRIQADLSALENKKIDANTFYNNAIEITKGKGMSHRAAIIDAYLGRGRWNVAQKKFKEAQSDFDYALNLCKNEYPYIDIIYKIHFIDILLEKAKIDLIRGFDIPAKDKAKQANVLSKNSEYYWGMQESNKILIKN